uniref:Uncharacterized protein n=1 Tax=viral metagenome TaxID=1070528 RepID=A0A6C0M1H9_9ZZZZ
MYCIYITNRCIFAHFAQARFAQAMATDALYAEIKAAVMRVLTNHANATFPALASSFVDAVGTDVYQLVESAMSSHRQHIDKEIRVNIRMTSSREGDTEALSRAVAEALRINSEFTMDAKYDDASVIANVISEYVMRDAGHVAWCRGDEANNAWRASALDNVRDAINETICNVIGQYEIDYYFHPVDVKYIVTVTVS